MNAPKLPPEAAALESIGHLKQKICLMWGSPELDVFISRLIMDSRDGQRQGLPMAVGAELLFLAQTNKIIRAIALAESPERHAERGLQDCRRRRSERLEADAFDNPLVSRDTIIRERNDNRRSGMDRRHPPKARWGRCVIRPDDFQAGVQQGVHFPHRFCHDDKTAVALPQINQPPGFSRCCPDTMSKP
jgi:hypothetical protein